MTGVLVRKLLGDVRASLVAVAALLLLYQVLWAKVTERILARISPFFTGIASVAGLDRKDLEDMVFEGPGQVARTLIGGDKVMLDGAMDLLSIGYVHPVVQIIFCVWAVGRAAGAVAGEIDRGTMELLLSQPVPRSRIILSHFVVELLTIPVLCLALWGGNVLGAWLIVPIQVEEPALRQKVPERFAALERLGLLPKPDPEAARLLQETRLKVEVGRFAPALVLVAGLLFSVSGLTVWLSAAGRSRWRVLGQAVSLVLVMFLLNLLGQMWEPGAFVRPLTVFYYYQPQQVILAGDWCVTLSEWNGGAPLARVPMPVVLFGVGALGYLMALWTLCRRDLPAPL